MEARQNTSPQEVQASPTQPIQPTTATITTIRNSEHVRIRAVSKLAAEVVQAWESLTPSERAGQSFQGFSERYLTQKARLNGGSLQ